MIVLVTNHHQRRHLHVLEPVFEIVERWPARLYAAHGIGRAAIGMGGEATGKLPPAARILVLKLYARWSERISLGRLYRQFIESLCCRLRFFGELQTILGRRAIATPPDHERSTALWISKTHVQGGKAAHRQANDMGFVDF